MWGEACPEFASGSSSQVYLEFISGIINKKSILM
jgi:hypothetical protein